MARDPLTAAPRPRPPRQSGSETRDQIVDAAVRCFAARGFHGTTTREVAGAAGLTEAALYRYFPSKEALYAAIIDRKMAAPEVTSQVEEAAAAGDDRAVFAGLARALLESLEGDPAFLRILLYTGLEGHALAEPFFATRVRRLRSFVTGYLERRIREGALRAVDPILASRALLGMLMDFAITRDVLGQREQYPYAIDEAAELFVSIFLDGLRTRKGPADV